MAVEVLRLGMDTRGLEAGSRRASKSLGTLQGSTLSVNRALGMLGVTLGAGMLFRGAINQARAFEDAQSSLITATGATGAALEQLNADARAVLVGVPQDIREVAQVLGELTTRVEGTGAEIRALTRDTLDFARITRTDATSAARDLAQLMNALDVPVRDASQLFDQLVFAAQTTGIAVNDLARAIIEAGPAFAEMGFGVERSIALFSQFERVGARPTEVIGSLNIALTRLARSGATDAEEAFSALLESIQEAPDLLAAVDIAADAFGSRVGGKVAEDIRAGLFEVDAFVEAMQGADGIFRQTADSALTSSERMQIAMNEMRVAIEPVSQMFLTVLAPAVITALGAVSRFIGGIQILGAEAPIAFTKVEVAWLKLQRILTLPGGVMRESIDEQLNAALALLPHLEQAAADVAREIVGGQEAAQELLRAFQETVDAAGRVPPPPAPPPDATEDTVRLLGKALDLDIQRQGLMPEALATAAQLRTIFEDQTRALEDRVEAAEKFRGLQGDILGSLDRQLKTNLATVDAVDGWISGMRDLPDAMNEPLEMSNQFGRNVEDGAEKFKKWVGAMQVVGSSLGGIASQIANVVGAFSAGGPRMGIAAALGVFVSVFNDRGREFEIAVQQWEDSLDRLVGLFADPSRLDAMRSQAQDAAEQAAAALVALLPDAFPGMDLLKDQLEDLLRSGDVEGVVELLRRMGVETRELEDAIRHATQRIEEWRQQEIASMHDDIAVRMLVAQGRDEEAEVLRLQLRHLSEIEAARALEDDALLRQLGLLHDIEMARLLEEQAMRDTADAIRDITTALNAPAGLNLALHRIRSMIEAPPLPPIDRISPPDGPTLNPTPIRDGLGSGTTTVHQGSRDIHINGEIHVHAHPGMDGEALIRDIERAAGRRASMGDPLDVGVEVR